MVGRRTFLRTAGGVAIGSALAGCVDSLNDGDSPAGGSDRADAGVSQVEVGPERRLRFEPDEVEISVGDTVRWVALSEGHNVTSHPDASEKCENPDGAEPFTSYEGDDHYAVMEVDETLENEFTVPGEYVYVCTPHDGQGMVGTVTVSE